MTTDAVPGAVLDIRTDALRQLSNGVYVLTTHLGETIHATTVTWVTQVSFHPPLVLVALQKNSQMAHSLRTAHRFALNILETGQHELAQSFFEHAVYPADVETIADFAVRKDPAHCPLLKDCLAWLECRLASEAPSPGDHTLILGEVTGAGVRRQSSPLVLWDTPWAYGGLQAP